MSTAGLGDGAVVVGVDGTDTSRHALIVAAELAAGLGARLRAVHALGLMTVIDGEHVSSEGRQEEVADHAQRRWCSHLDQIAGLHWDVDVIYGSPPDVLLHAARDRDASLIVVGTRAAHREAELGSTSHHVVHHSDRPVVVVPPPG
ncbi:MAG: universal stress protein [Actinomycetota bacterium]